jgi:hypothetical protein
MLIIIMGNQLQRSNKNETKILNDLEFYLNDFNSKLTATSQQNIFTDNLLECFIIKLFDLIKQNSQQLKHVNIEKVKTTLLSKLTLLNLTDNRLRQFEIKNVELERKSEQLNLELDSLKQAINCKKLYSDGELSVVCNELMKWKSAMKQISSKVFEQNKLIHLLVKKCEDL